MSFGLSSLKFCRAGIAGFVCLALVAVSHAGEGSRNIEVVPMHGTEMDTNFDQSSPSDSQRFQEWSPHAPRPFKSEGPRSAILPLPRTQNPANSEREKELLDRRRNWVFMTPEDYASQDGKKDSDGKNPDDDKDKKPMTAMERYYQRMYDSDQMAATNQLGKMDSDRSSSRTNLLGGEQRDIDGKVFGDSPFNSTPDSDMMQSVRHGSFADVFGSDNGTAMPTPESVRAEAEQKAHMESFKQLWNIDQPAPAPVSAPASTAVDSGPLFGLSSPGMQPASPSFGSSGGNSSSTEPQTPEPTVTSSRANRPPRSDFRPQQRPF